MSVVPKSLRTQVAAQEKERPNWLVKHKKKHFVRKKKNKMV